MITLGLERLLSERDLQDKVKGDIGYLCHSASVTQDLELGVGPLMRVFGPRLKKLFGPQHGLVTDVQDNMVETPHTIHPYYKLPVYSLYSETRIPTDDMLKGLGTLLVDLQDVGTRVYTYISTLNLLLKKCGEKGIKVIVLDRPNPVGADIIEGPVLDLEYQSFVGRQEIPQRHGMTMGEVGALALKHHGVSCEYEVITMKGWDRRMSWRETGREWINPSPNLSTPESAYSFVGTVLYEGTNVSEGRGTTRALEVIAHPKLNPYEFLERHHQDLEPHLQGAYLRPITVFPTFHKWSGIPCGGLHMHVTDKEKMRPWALAQVICYHLYHDLGADFEFHQKPYEYEFHKLAIDLINGTDKVRQWIENKGPMSELTELNQLGHSKFLTQRADILLYS